MTKIDRMCVVLELRAMWPYTDAEGIAERCLNAANLLGIPVTCKIGYAEADIVVGEGLDTALREVQSAIAMHHKAEAQRKAIDEIVRARRKWWQW